MTARALIVGAGPAGLSAAMQLATWCDGVEVVEARPRTALRHTGEHLPPAGLTYLATIGFADILSDPRHQTSSGVCSAWGADRFAEKDYFFTPAGQGKNLRRSVFDEALAQSVAKLGVTLRFSTRLVDVTAAFGRYEAILRDAVQTETRSYDILIDASGRNARAARLLGAKVDRVDDMVGICAQIDGCDPLDDIGRLYIEAVEGGWWYGVQFAEGQVLCTYMTDAVCVSRHPGGAIGLWQETLAKTGVLAPLVESGVHSNDIHVFDASTQTVQDQDLSGFLTVGDAAVAFDPLSSWGITKGMVDGHHGAQALQRERGGASGTLAQHKAERRAQFQDYRRQRKVMYRAEGRWPHSEFWQARQRSTAAIR